MNNVFYLMPTCFCMSRTSLEWCVRSWKLCLSPQTEPGHQETGVFIPFEPFEFPIMCLCSLSKHF